MKKIIGSMEYDEFRGGRARASNEMKGRDSDGTGVSTNNRTITFTVYIHIQ